MPGTTPCEGEVVMLMEHMNGTPLQVKQIREWTRRDRVLSRVHQWLLQATAEKLRGIFATHGIPAVLVSDNGPSLEGIKKMGEGSVETKLSRFLFKYRSTPQTTTGATPAELLMNGRIRTGSEADSVYVRGYAGQKWIPATLIERTGPVSWRVKTQDDKLVRRHQDQIHKLNQIFKRRASRWTQHHQNLKMQSDRIKHQRR
ncbi:hypothetical protein AAFF_G00192690 [Aldrovandia affinis]|uniref:Integrase catalytic domain-containing protein n=1 Tax=Aldrovandia affinis TaxID=143900 RepID=A0AAD7RJ59_9TELE|nr:hypothetical protein AAFF_G00192690 [Aldrovandia affinis]